MRAIWNGSILFGEVVIPIGLVPSRRDGGIGFRSLHRGSETEPCGMPLNQQLVCPAHGPLEESEIVKGYEIAAGQYVPLEQDELETVAPEAGKEIPLQALIPAGELDELAVETSYFLKPSSAPIGQRAYVLLAGVLRETGMVALARLVYSSNEWIVAVRPLGESGPTLILQRLVAAGERVDHAPLEEQLAGVTITDSEAHLGRELGMRLFTHLAKKPALLENTHRDRVTSLVDAKLAGQPILRPAPAPKQTQMPASGDLADALTRSIRATRKTRARKPATARH